MPGDPSARLASGALPKDVYCIRAFDLTDPAPSPFVHYEIIPKEALED